MLRNVFTTAHVNFNVTLEEVYSLSSKLLKKHDNMTRGSRRPGCNYST